MVARQNEDTASYLQKVSTPNLYINNAFRATKLDVTATLREAKKLIKEKEQCHKLGIPFKSERQSYFPVSASLSVDDIRIAVDQKLSDPFCRIIEELFWFWPGPNKGIADDEALRYLRALDIDGAKKEWLASACSWPEDSVALHNLAVLHHLQALEAEQSKKLGGCFNLRCENCGEYFWIAAKNSNLVIVCPNCRGQVPAPSTSPNGDLGDDSLSGLWEDAYIYWSRVWMNAYFWAELSLRARSIDENIGKDFIDNIRQELPEALLTINARLAIDYCTEGNISEATRHAQILRSSNFSEKHQSSAIRYSTSALIDQVHQQAKLAEEKANANPESGLQEAINLLNQTRPNIKCFEILNCNSMSLGFAACDAVAETALGALISYGNVTTDSNSLIAPAKEILEIAKSSSIKERISNNLAIIVSNAHQNIINEQIKPVTTICESISKAIRSIGQNEKGRVLPLYWKFKNEVLPRLEEIKARFGQESEEYKYASNVCAYCMREISVAFHNIDQDMEVALESIKWAKSLCTDPKVQEILLKDIRICEQDAAAHREIRKRKLRARYKFWAWVVGIGGLILFSVIKDCVDKNSSSSNVYSPSAVASSTNFSSNLPSDAIGTSRDGWTYSLPNQNSGTRTSGSESPNPSLGVPNSSVSSEREALLQEINDGRLRVKQLESQLEDITNSLENYKRQLDYYKTLGDADNYNRLVPLYNDLLRNGKDVYAEYSNLLVEVNAKIDRYNRNLY